MASIGLGVAIVILSFHIQKGFRTSIEEKVYSQSGHIQAYYSDDNYSQEETPFNYKKEPFYNGWKKNPNISQVQVYLNKACLLHHQEEIKGVILKGVGDDFQAEVFKKNITKGRFLNLQDTTETREAIISQRIATEMQIALNDTVTFIFIGKQAKKRKLQIAGIYATGLEEIDAKAIITDIKLLRHVMDLGDTAVGGYEIYITNPEEHTSAKEWIDKNTSYDLSSVSVQQKYIQVFEWLKLIDRNVWVVVLLICMVAAFNMISTMIIMVIERTSMIGLLKAIGTTNTQILNIFVFNGLNILWKGLLVGNIIGLGLSAIQYYWQLMPLDPAAYYMDSVPIAFDWMAWLLINVCTIVLICVLILIPILSISKISPAKSIKFY